MRRSKLTEEVTDNLCKAIEMGMTYKLACQFAGISEATFYSWMKQGRENIDEKFVEFLESIKKAESKGALLNLAIIQKAAKEGSWQASCWLMERRHGYHIKQDPIVNIEIDKSNLSMKQLIEELKETDKALKEVIQTPVIDLDEE